MDLQGKTVLVTGASSGIGQAIAIAFAQKRAHVLVHYGKNKAGAQATLDEVKKVSSGSLHQADLMDRDQIDALFANIKTTNEDDRRAGEQCRRNQSRARSATTRCGTTNTRTSCSRLCR